MRKGEPFRSEKSSWRIRHLSWDMYAYQTLDVPGSEKHLGRVNCKCEAPVVEMSWAVSEQKGPHAWRVMSGRWTRTLYSTVGEGKDLDVFQTAGVPLMYTSRGPHFPCCGAAFILALEISDSEALVRHLTGDVYQTVRCSPGTLQRYRGWKSINRLESCRPAAYRWQLMLRMWLRFPSKSVRSRESQTSCPTRLLWRRASLSVKRQCKVASSFSVAT